MNCAATQHLHAGAFSKNPPRLLILLCHPDLHTHALTLLRKGQQMQMTQLTSTSLPCIPPPMLPFTLFEGCILVFGLSSGAQVTLPTIPLTCWHKLGHKTINHKATMVTWVCPLLLPDPLSASLHPFWAWTNNHLIEAKSCTVVEIQHLLPPSSSSKDRKGAIMFKHPHYGPQVSCCGSLSIKGFNRWRKSEWERESGGGGGGGSKREGQWKGRAKGGLETVLFFYWFESWLPLAAPQ